ncbi:MAG TPA: radical SAM protein [Thermoanaerobaculia bacterium]|nr:radical SAM protein [Thermoanaerobaculia bacterium]
MSFANVLAKTWRDNLLFSVLVELTYRCNLDCFFCYNDLGLQGEPMRREEYLRFFADLRDLQVLNLTLSGGEPLAHPDFLLLGRTARELGFVVRIKSNGHALRGELARRIREEVDPFLIEVSLHGATAATHDRQTRVAGSFDRLLGNLEEMARLGLRVKVNSTLTAWNEGEIEGMFELVTALGLNFQVDPEVTPRDDGSREPLAVSPTREGVLRLFALQEEWGRKARLQAAEAEDGGAADAASLAPPVVALGGDDGSLPSPDGKHCGAGSSGIAVDPFGNVYPCVQWRRPVGNLHRQSIREIWMRSAGLKEIRELTAEAKKVVDGYGPAGQLLNFCPGSAAAHGGDPLTVYPSAIRRMELALEAQQGAKKVLLPIV